MDFLFLCILASVGFWVGCFIREIRKSKVLIPADLLKQVEDLKHQNMHLKITNKGVQEFNLHLATANKQLNFAKRHLDGTIKQFQNKVAEHPVIVNGLQKTIQEQIVKIKNLTDLCNGRGELILEQEDAIKILNTQIKNLKTQMSLKATGKKVKSKKS